MNRDKLRKAILLEVKKQLRESDFPIDDNYSRAYELASSADIKKFDDTIINLTETWMSHGFDVAESIDILTNRMQTVLRNY